MSSEKILEELPKRRRSKEEIQLLRDYLEEKTGQSMTLAESEMIADQLEDPIAARKRSIDSAAHTKRKLDDLESSSSLSPASQIPSPNETTIKSNARPVLSPSSSSSSLDTRQLPPTASMAQFQTFGPDPSTFDDPTVYEIREVTDDMTEEEKKSIYCVNSFPKSDLSHLIAGTLPDKDFSNAKPTNQVNANTFAAYIEPYVRPLTEEDMAWLKERVSSKLSFSEIWSRAY